jgi:hypothetical protein
VGLDDRVVVRLQREAVALRRAQVERALQLPQVPPEPEPVAGRGAPGPRAPRVAREATAGMTIVAMSRRSILEIHPSCSR